MKIYLELNKEVQEIFAENRISIAQLLIDNSIDAEVADEKLPLEEESGSTSKPLIPVIIASSVAIVAITHAITQILKTVYSKPHWIEYDELEELRDANGDIITGNDGKPLFKSVKKHALVEPLPKHTKSEFESALNKTDGLILKVKTEEDGTKG